jgi:hypothetical protein
MLEGPEAWVQVPILAPFSHGIDEILSVVNVAPGDASVFACDRGDANGDGQITVDEILAAVSNALSGCRRS